MIYAFTHLWVIQILLLKHFSDGSYHFFGISPQNTFFLLLAFYLFLFASKKSRLFIWCRFFLANLSGLARIVKVTFCTIILQRINGQPAPVALCSLRRSLDFLSTSQAFLVFFFLSLLEQIFRGFFGTSSTIFVGKPRIRMEFPHLMELLFQ